MPPLGEAILRAREALLHVLLDVYHRGRPKDIPAEGVIHPPQAGVTGQHRLVFIVLEALFQRLGDDCCNWQGLSPVLMPLTGLAPASPYFGLRAMGQLSFPQ